MKNLIGVLAVLAIAFSTQAQLPATPIKDIKGQTIAFNKTVESGKVTLISFWADWCIPCKKEIKAVSGKLEQWQKEVDFNYITISVDNSQSTEKAKTYARQQGWSFPAYFDVNSDLMRSINFQNVPFTIIVDQNGKIVSRHTAYKQGSEEELFKTIKELAGKK